MTSDHNEPATDDRIDMELDTPVTTVIVQQPKPNAIATYENWLKEIVPVAKRFAGHAGVNIIRPQEVSGVYTIVLHFDTIENLRGWLNSETRARLIAKIRPHLQADERIDIKTGLEFWFTPALAKSAPRYKQFLVTLSAIWPLTILVPWLFAPLFKIAPVLGLPGISHLLIATIIVWAMAYVIMPRYTRLISRWLFENSVK